MRDDIVKLAGDLIKIRSTSDNPEEIDHVLNFATTVIGSDFQVDRFTDNTVPSLLIHNQPSSIKEFELILNAHLDVVPADQSLFEPIVKEGRLYGRGAYDMKAAAAVMMLVFKELAGKVSYPLGLQLVTDEETGGFHGTNYQVNQGVRSEFVIAGENTNLEINNKAKGVVWLQVSTKGKTAHGAYPWLGENALTKLNKGLNMLLEQFPVPAEAAWKTTINVAKIETENTTYNKVPDQATAWLDVRVVPEEMETIVKKLQDAVPDDFDVNITFQEPGQYCPETNLSVVALKKAIETVTQQPAKMRSSHGSADVRFFEKVNGAAVCLGPIGNGHHSDEEWVDLQSLNDYYTILHNFLLAIDQK